MIKDKGICLSPVHTITRRNDGELVQEQPQTSPAAMTDVLRNTWCAECLHRGEFLNWGKAHGWPALEIHPYAMERRASSWQITATQGDEDRIWTFLGLIEMLDATSKVAEEEED